jgi:hypothetical protein
MQSFALCVLELEPIGHTIDDADEKHQENNVESASTLGLVCFLVEHLVLRSTIVNAYELVDRHANSKQDRGHLKRGDDRIHIGINRVNDK